jgi:hypothetical protein
VTGWSVETPTRTASFTGRDLLRSAATGADHRPPREPFLPGGFTIGDVRTSSVKRVAVAVARAPWPSGWSRPSPASTSVDVLHRSALYQDWARGLPQHVAGHATIREAGQQRAVAAPDDDHPGAHFSCHLGDVVRDGMR